MLVIALQAYPAAAQLDPVTQVTGYATVGTDARRWGLSQVYDEDAAAEIGIDFDFPSRFFAGASIGNVSYSTGTLSPGPRDYLLRLYAGYGWEGAQWSVGASLGHYRYPDTVYDYDYNEITLVLGYRDRFFYDISVTDDLLPSSRTAVNHEIGITWPLPGNIELSAGLGELEVRGSELSYTHHNIGVTKLLGPFSVDLRRYDTSREIVNYLGSSAADEWVLSFSYAVSLKD